MKTDSKLTMNASDMLAECDAFTLAYLECALWSSTEYDDEGNIDEPLDESYSVDDIHPDSLQMAIDDCESFQDDEQNASDMMGLDPTDCGHDFWLTRNGHGAGFWDRGLGERGERLSKASKVYGGRDLVVCAGKIRGF